MTPVTDPPDLDVSVLSPVKIFEQQTLTKQGPLQWGELSPQLYIFH